MEEINNQGNEISVQVDMGILAGYIKEVTITKIRYFNERLDLDAKCRKSCASSSVNETQSKCDTEKSKSAIRTDRHIILSLPAKALNKRSQSNEFYNPSKISSRRLRVSRNPIKPFTKNSCYQLSAQQKIKKRSEVSGRSMFLDPNSELSALFNPRPYIISHRRHNEYRKHAQPLHQPNPIKESLSQKSKVLDLTISNSVSPCLRRVLIK